MLAWIDLEMTGLDPAQNVIVEIATLITDNDLKIHMWLKCIRKVDF